MINIEFTTIAMFAVVVILWWLLNKMTRDNKIKIQKLNIN